MSLEVEDKDAPLDAVQRVGSEIAMHVVAAKPLFLTKEDVTSDALGDKCDILRSQVPNAQVHFLFILVLSPRLQKNRVNCFSFFGEEGTVSYLIQ